MSYFIHFNQIHDFYRHLQQEERAKATIEKYVHDVRRFKTWVGDKPVTKEVVTAWKDHLSRCGYAPVTVNAALAALHSFFAFAGWENCCVRYLKIQQRMFRDASRELDKREYRQLVDGAHRNGDICLSLILETICATGIRVSELRYITVEAVQRGRADISLKGKIRTILISGKLAKKLKKYAQKQKIVSGEIFLTKNGRGISRQQIWREMKKLCKTVGVEEKKVFPHNLRHLFARVFYHSCRDIVHLADVLGHSSIETTRIYLLTTGTEHAKCLERLKLVS